MPDKDLIRLRHMLDAAREAIAFAEGRTRDDLSSDRQLVLALVKCIEIVGEAASQVSPGAQAKIRGLPWRDITDMRHRLVHAYYDINLDILWSTVQEDLPPLVKTLAAEPGPDPAGPA